MMRMAGRGDDGLAKAIQTDKHGNIITMMGGSQSTLIKEYIGDTSLLTSVARSFGSTTGTTTIGVTPFDVSDFRGREFFVNNKYDVDISVRFWAFKSFGEATHSTRMGEVHRETVKAGEQKTIDSENLNGRYAGLVAFVVCDVKASTGSMDMILFGSSDVNVREEKTDKNGNIITTIGGSQSSLLKEHIGDTSLLSSATCSFGSTTGTTTSDVIPFDVSDFRGREFFVNNKYDVDISISFWSFKNIEGPVARTRLGEIHTETVKAGEQKTIDSEKLNGRYGGMVAFVRRLDTPSKGSMDIVLFGSSDVNKTSDLVDIINLVENYTDITEANQFIGVDNNGFIRVDENITNKYKTIDIVVTNKTSTPFRLAVRCQHFTGLTEWQTIRLANGDYSEFSTSFSDSASQIIIPENCTALNVSHIPITRVGDGMEAYDPHMWQKYSGNLEIRMRSMKSNSRGFVSVWLIGYK